jgi:hypothetical protein
LALTTLYTQLLIPPSIEISWKTESELDTAGFNLLKSETRDGDFVLINQSMIPGSDDPIIGKEYQYIDEDVIGGETYYYLLEEVELDSSVNRHEIIEASTESKPWWLLAIAGISAIIGVSIILKTALLK